jgi:hypothetical protein
MPHREIRMWIASRAAAAALTLASISAAGGCTRSQPAPVRPPATATPPATAPSGGYPPPSLPTSASCRLLTVDEVRNAFGGGEVQSGFGNTFPSANGNAGFPVRIEQCSWQQHSGPEPGRSIDVIVDTTASEDEATREYAAFVANSIENTAPGVTPIPVPGIGTQAVRIPEWLIARRGAVVLAVSIAGMPGQAPDPRTLESLARTASGRLGW